MDIKIILSSMMTLISILMFNINHPLLMGLMILIQTILISLISGMLIKTYWFSYILLLTFLGGLLVLFIYVASIASNEMFKNKKKINFFFIWYFIILFMMMMMFNKNLNWMNLSNSMSEIDNLFNMMFFNNENKINLSKLYNNQTFLLMMMMVIYLFITLISIVKITNIFYGPLRTKN